ncbi:hypothetical protein OESDEN_13949 [Oesophagostomum dentatum]|uniref:Calcineurin-like phosphoesterase domain-containing protein n=1 Tax=Oesophagostomum dentatum TaxID=61180 RepID=A0A0B1SQY3_OESDE|nr:hypothetical protein OESDEN_13949 [Oesophagostomum dentatum]
MLITALVIGLTIRHLVSCAVNKANSSLVEEESLLINETSKVEEIENFFKKNGSNDEVVLLGDIADDNDFNKTVKA